MIANHLSSETTDPGDMVPAFTLAAHTTGGGVALSVTDPATNQTGFGMPGSMPLKSHYKTIECNFAERYSRFGADLPAAYFRIARVQTGKEIGITPDVKIHASHDQAVTDVGLPDPWRCDFSFGTPITGTDPIGPTLSLLKILPDYTGAIEAYANGSL